MTKILVAHNGPNTLKGLRESLDPATYVLIATNRLKAALRKLETDTSIDLLVIDTDFQQAELDRFLENIRSSRKFLDLPIIMTSYQWSPASITHFKEMGAKDCIALPLSADLIESRLGQALASGKRTILVVDDEELIRDLLKNVLELERFKVLEAANARQALAILEKNTVHAVISDILMPGMTGLELLQIMKKRHQDIPVIMITGFSGDYTPDDVMAAGADGYFAKPFKNLELTQKLRSVLKVSSRPAQPSPV